MLARRVVSEIARDDALTRGLGDPEALALVEWVVDRAERLSQSHEGESLTARLFVLRRQGRALAHFVRLWCHDNDRRAACQLAAVERFDWPLPTKAVDPCELMQSILRWEGRRPTAA